MERRHRYFFADDEQHVLVSVPERINPEMQAVLDYEQMLLSNPLSAVLTLAFMMGFLVLIGAAFWKRSLGWGLAVLNVTLIGKVVLSVMLTGKTAGRPSEMPCSD